MPPSVPTVIYKVYDLLMWLMERIAKFPRSHRFVLGDRMERLVLDVLELLIEAAYSRDKQDVLKQKLRYLVRASKDCHCLVIVPFALDKTCFVDSKWKESVYPCYQ